VHILVFGASLEKFQGGHQQHLQIKFYCNYYDGRYLKGATSWHKLMQQ